MLRIVSTVLVSFTAAVVGGCNPVSVNVPPLPGDTAFHSPNNEGVVRVEAVALEYAISRWPAGSEYSIDLPYGTTEESYASVLVTLPAGAWRVSAAPDTPTYRVAQVRMRSTTALVDIVVPSQPAEQLVTVTCVKDDVVGPWYARSARVWRIPVEEALMMSAPGLAPAPDPADPAHEPTEPETPAEPESTTPGEAPAAEPAASAPAPAAEPAPEAPSASE